MKLIECARCNRGNAIYTFQWMLFALAVAFSSDCGLLTVLRNAHNHPTRVVIGEFKDYA